MAFSHALKRFLRWPWTGPFESEKQRELAKETVQLQLDQIRAERIAREEKTEEKIVATLLSDVLSPSFLVASPNPILAGAASVFNLAGSVDEPVIGLMQPGGTPDEAVELSPFYVDQAERILSQAEKLMQSSERILKERVKRDFSRRPTFPVTLVPPPHEANRSETDQEGDRKKSKRTP